MRLKEHEMVRTKQTARKSASDKSRDKRQMTTKSAPKSSTAVASSAVTKETLKKKARRFHPGVRALMDIRHWQKTTDLLIQKLPFQRLVREIAAECKSDLRFQGDAILALQEASEAYLVEYFQDAVQCAIHAGRVTIQVEDMQVVQRLEKRKPKHKRLNTRAPSNGDVSF